MKNGYVALCCIISSGLSAYAVHQFWKKKHRDEMNELRDRLDDIYHEKLASETEKIADETREAVKLECGKNSENEKTEMEKAVEKEKITILNPEEYGDEREFARFQYRYYPENECFVNTDYDMAVDDDEIFGMVGDDIKERLEESDEVYVRNWDLEADIAIYRGEGSYDY